MLKLYKNEEEIKSAKGQIRGERFDEKDIKLIYFGDNGNSSLFNSDSVEMTVYDTDDNLLYWSDLSLSYQLWDEQSVVINNAGISRMRILPGQYLRPAGFSRGLYRVVFSFFRHILGTPSGNKVFLEKISPSRKEIRILPVKTADENNNAVFNVDFYNFTVNMLQLDVIDEVLFDLRNYAINSPEDTALQSAILSQPPINELPIPTVGGQAIEWPDVFEYLETAFQSKYKEIRTLYLQRVNSENLLVLIRTNKEIIKNLITVEHKDLFPTTIGNNLASLYAAYRFNLIIDSFFTKYGNIKTNVLSHNLVANFGNNTVIPVVNVVRDDVAYTEYPYSYVLKLYEPLPDDIKEKAQLWIDAELSQPVIEKVYLLGTEEDKIDGRILAGPNFDAKYSLTQGRSVGFESWDDILSTHPTSSTRLIEKYISGSLLEGIDINIDFTDYKNFVLFGSAYERLANFYYKMQLLEEYDSRMATIYTITGGASESINVLSGSMIYQQKKREIINTFDSYERYLYYESGSQYSSSVEVSESVYYNPIGEWPKRNSIYPYTLYSYSSSQVTAWYATQSDIARIYDQYNGSSLVDNMPFHLQFDELNSSFIDFMNMMGQYYDVFYTYIKALSNLSSRYHDMRKGLAKDLTFYVAKSFGFDLSNGNDYVELWKYAFGTDVSGSLLQISFSGSGANSGSGATIINEAIKSKPYGDITKEIWRRILNNMPYIYKTKGTPRSIKALLACYGIPTSIISIREYGGPDPREYPEISDRSQYTFEDFVYAIDFDGAQQVSRSWENLDSYSEKPHTLEIRFKTTYAGTATQSIVNAGSNWGISLYTGSTFTPVKRWPGVATPVRRQEGKVVYECGTTVLSSSDFSFFDGNWYSVVLTTYGDGAGAYSQSLYVKRGENGRMVYESSMSAASGSNYEADDVIYVGGDGTNFGDHFSGSIMEFRLFQPALSESVFDNHVLWPKSYNSNTVTGSYDDLVLRWSFDEPKNHSIDDIVSDVKADQTTNNSGHAGGFANEINYSADTEEFYALVPSIGIGKYISNKIRIEKAERLSGSLSTYRSIQKSAFDNAPLDSNRVGIFFTPLDSINNDMIATFAGEDLTGYIGDPRDLYEEEYDDLKVLQDFYWQKYTGTQRNINYNKYIRIINYFDKSLFDQIKQLIPARAQLEVGVILEPNILERYKVKRQKPVVYENHYSTSLYLGDGKIKSMSGSFTLSTASISQTDIYSLSSSFISTTASVVVRNYSSSSLSCSIGYIPPITEVLSGSVLEHYNQQWAEDNIFGYRVKYYGISNTKYTTIDGLEPVEIFLTNPNTLIATDRGPSKLKVE